MKYLVLLLPLLLAGCAQKPKAEQPSLGALPDELNKPLKKLTKNPETDTPNNVILARHAQLRKDFSDNSKSCKLRTAYTKELHQKANELLQKCYSEK